MSDMNETLLKLALERQQPKRDTLGWAIFLLVLALVGWFQWPQIQERMGTAATTLSTPAPQPTTRPYAPPAPAPRVEVPAPVQAAPAPALAAPAPAPEPTNPPVRTPVPAPVTANAEPAYLPTDAPMAMDQLGGLVLGGAALGGGRLEPTPIPLATARPGLVQP